MGVILQANYRRQANPTVSVPAPRDGNGDPWWYDHLAHQLPAIAGAGFTHIQLPPVHMTIGGDSQTSDGYGVYWEYDLGTEGRPTRFGSAERLQRLCAIAWANGVQPMADWVPHQRYGGNGGYYSYKSACGRPGRFPKSPGCFLGAPPRVPRDPIAGPARDDYAFGDELCPINAHPKGYVLEGLQRAGDWLYARLNLVGCRNDDTKGQAFEAVRRWATYGAMAGKPCIGEYAEGNRDTLAWWLDNVPANCMTFDFETKYRVRDFCNNGSRFNMAQLQWSGLATKGPQYAARSVTFLENADSDTNGFGAVVFNKLLGYAWILTAEGWPCVYYRDYAQEKYCYGLKPHIDNLIWIHEHLANGPTIWRHAEYQYVVYERAWAPGLLVGLNNDIWGGWKTVNVQTNFGAHVHLHDYTGHSGDVRTDGGGRVTIGIPPNDNGKGYVCYSRAGLDRPNITSGSHTVQVFEGAEDLDLLPAMGSQTVTVTRIWPEANTEISLRPLHTDPELVFTIYGPDARPVATEERSGRTRDRGWHAVAVTSSKPEDTMTPYKVAITYTAPNKL